MKSSRISLTLDQHVAHVELARAEKMNALDKDMFKALLETAQQIKDNGSIRAVVLSGKGGNFCSGLDKSNFASVMQGNGLNVSDDPDVKTLAQRTDGIYNQVQAVVWQWRDLKIPVIAAVEGVVLGGGLQIALAADMRYADINTQFSILEIKWGIIPDMGSTQIMRHLIRDDIVRELTYTGRIFSSQEAKNYGFITEVVDNPIDHALSIARQISQQNPQAVQACKKLLNSAPYLNVEQGLLMESELQDQIIGSSNQIEAVKAVLEKREARFVDQGD